VAAGVSYQRSTSGDFAVARYEGGGALDTTFGGDGIVTTDFASPATTRPGFRAEGHQVAIQPDGKIIVAGHSITHAKYADPEPRLARYNPDGTLDDTFGEGGRIRHSFRADIRGLALAADGKIVVVGSTYSYRGDTGWDFFLARYTADGTLDTTFDGDGWLATDLGTEVDYAHAVILQADGKIVVAGSSYRPNRSNGAIVRYNADGTLDRSFGGDGWITPNRYYTSLAAHPDGKLVAAGLNGALARFNEDGTPDSSFDGDGEVIVGFPSRSVAVQRDGKIVTAGGTNEYYQVGDPPDDDPWSEGDPALPHSRFKVARYNADGSPDTSFGGDGTVTTDFGGSLYDSDEARSIVVQANGKIVVAGSSYRVKLHGGAVSSPFYERYFYDFAVARYNADGALDVSFGADGTVAIDFGVDDLGSSVALDDSGRIVVAGSSGGAWWFEPLSFAVARLQGTSTPQDLVDLLTRRIDKLTVDGRPTRVQGDYLKNKLKHVIEMIDAGQWDAAGARLDSFIKHVSAWDGTILTPEEARLLIDLAELILEADARVITQFR
jgi:uncharacterized delta-60 repeat protein